MRVRNTLLTIVVVFATTASTFFSGLYFTNSSLEKTVEQDLTFAIGIADALVGSHMDLLKTEAISISMRFSQAKPGAELSNEELEQLMEELFNEYPDVSAYTVFDRNGTIASYSEPDHSHDLSMHNQYIEMVYKGDTIISSPFYCEVLEEYVMNVYTPYGSNSILAVTISGMAFSDLLAGHQLWQTGNIFMLNEDGAFIGLASEDIVSAMDNYTDRDEHDLTHDEDQLRELVQNILLEDSGVETYTHEGVTRMCAHSIISNSVLGWRVAVSVSLDESPQASIMQGQVYAAMIFLAVGIIAAFFLVRLAMRPFSELEAQNRKQEQMIDNINNKDRLLQAVNDVADQLLATETKDFEKTLLECMGNMAVIVGADRMRVIKNYYDGNTIFRSQLFEWCDSAAKTNHVAVADNVSYDERLPEIKGILMRGQTINTLSKDMPTIDRKWLDEQEILAFMLVPVFINEKFWGFVGFYKSQSEQLFTEDEESIMHSGSLIIVNALLRNESILDIQDASDKLEVALEVAKNANKAKSNFLAHMSHEMRTPLNAVMGLSELALTDENVNDETEDKLEKIHSSGTTLLSIINDILDISKIESGKFELLPTKYDTPSMINDVVTLNIVRVGEKPIDFKLHVDESLPSVIYGDDLRVKQIFNNVLSNAFKYTGAGSVEWELSHERDGSDVWLVSCIKDTGIGMKSEHIDNLFTDYYQVERSTNRKVEGTGLGLSITKQLVDMMGGTIDVQSEYEKGTTVKLRIKQKFVSDVPIGISVSESLMGMNYALSKRVSSTSLVRLNMSYASVLVVDDIATNLDVVCGMLKPYKMKIDCVISGYEAIDVIRKGSPRYSAIFMDHMMPGIDGIEATRFIREEIGTDYAKNIPVIALTANAILGNEEMFLRNGFQAFISKPIDIVKLDAVLREWVRDPQLEAELPDASINATQAEIDSLNGEDDRDQLNDIEINGIDKEKALRRFSWDSLVLIDVLRSYAENTPQLLSDLERYLDDGDLQNYAIAVHGIKGSSYGICADEVGRLAESLERAAKAEDIGVVRSGHNSFEHATKVLLQGIGAALDSIESKAFKPMAEYPDSALLQEMRDACKAFDIGRVNAAMQQLESIRYKSGGNIVEWLREKVSDMEFLAISDGEWPLD